MTKSIVVVAVLLAACGPQKRNGNGNGNGSGSNAGPDAPGTTCQPSAEVCNDGIDNDCDGNVDCGDSDCSGIDGCPVCGEVMVPNAASIPLPDGIESGTTCSTDADCAGQTAGSPAIPTPNCIVAGDSSSAIHECHASYDSTLDFIGFPAGATLTDTSKLINVCVTMEHTWLRDLHMELLAPPDPTTHVRPKMTLQKWLNRTTFIEEYLGQPIDNDDNANPIVPGVGYQYCWTAQATQDMLAAPTTTWNTHKDLPAGDFKPDSPFSDLAGAQLNGMWSIRVTDLWASDNGFLFSWSIKFDPSLVASCNGPIIQ